MGGPKKEEEEIPIVWAVRCSGTGEGVLLPVTWRIVERWP